LERWQLSGKVVATCTGQALDLIEFHHPLSALDAGFERTAPVYLADYATADDGTGIVHSAPAYGVDDFNSCVAHGMKYTDILNPVQGNGAYAADFPLFGGQHIWKAVPVILEALQNADRLMATQTITHSYPHCWRHKTPVIYRAAAQWFIRMDAFDSTTEKTTGQFITDKAIKHLAEQCTQLTEINFGYCDKLTDVGIKHLVKHCPQLTEIDLCYCIQLTDNGTENLAKHCHALTKIFLRGCKKLTDVSLDKLGEGCPKLKKVSVYHCPQITRAAKDRLKQLLPEIDI
jgi:hypothetical protein